MQVAMKVKVRSVTHHEPLNIPGYNDGVTVVLVPVMDTSIPEAERHHAHPQPSGEFKIHVTNPAVAEWMKPGRRFRLTIVEEAAEG